MGFNIDDLFNLLEIQRTLQQCKELHDKNSRQLDIHTSEETKDTTPTKTFSFELEEPTQEDEICTTPPSGPSAEQTKAIACSEKLVYSEVENDPLLRMTREASTSPKGSVFEADVSGTYDYVKLPPIFLR